MTARRLFPSMTMVMRGLTTAEHGLRASTVLARLAGREAQTGGKVLATCNTRGIAKTRTYHRDTS